jgi:hypothetical protein
MTPGHRVTPVLGRGTSGLLFGTAWYPPVPEEVHNTGIVLVPVSTLSLANRQLGREWSSSLTLIRAKLHGTAATVGREGSNPGRLGKNIHLVGDHGMARHIERDPGSKIIDNI